MQKSIAIILLIFLLGFSACETFLVLELPPHEPKFVINTSLEVGKPIHVFVSKSRSILQENDFENVGDATVEIFVDGGRSYRLHHGQVEHNGMEIQAYSTTELEIEAGKTYEVIVSGADMPTATGKATVPMPVEIKSVELRSAPRDQTAFVDFAVRFDDNEGANFYEITVHKEGEMEPVDGIDPNRFIINQFVRLEAKNPIYENDFRYRIGILFDDRLFNGREANMEFSAMLIPNIDLDVTIYLKTVTEDYFNYENALNLQEANRGDPIAQPVQVVNNIQGGFGIVKASVTTQYTVSFNNRTD